MRMDIDIIWYFYEFLQMLDCCVWVAFDQYFYFRSRDRFWINVFQNNLSWIFVIIINLLIIGDVLSVQIFYFFNWKENVKLRITDFLANTKCRLKLTSTTSKATNQSAYDSLFLWIRLNAIHWYALIFQFYCASWTTTPFNKMLLQTVFTNWNEFKCIVVNTVIIDYKT